MLPRQMLRSLVKLRNVSVVGCIWCKDTLIHQLWEKFKINGSTNLQKQFVGQIENRLATEVLEADGTESIRARLHSASSKYAHRWLTSLPSDKFMILTDNQFSLALRNLLALPI